MQKVYVITVLKRRADFLAAARSGFKFVKPTLVVQSRKRDAENQGAASSEIRIGFTVTKALGGAVIRNRVKRRMRAAAAQLVLPCALPGCDYVFIGRERAIVCDFDDLIRDMKHALKRLSDQMSGIRSPKSEP